MSNSIPAMFKSFRKETRGVSELIGYILTFSIIISMVILVTISATPIIENKQSQESSQAIETSFHIIDDSVSTIQQGARNQFTTVDIPAGQLRQIDKTTINFTQPNTDTELMIETHPVEYTTTNGQTVVYEAKFIAASPNADTEENRQIRHLPTEHHMGETPVIQIPELTNDAGRSASSSSRSRAVTFQMNKTNNEAQSTSKVFHETDGDVVNINVTTEIPYAWKTYLTKHNALGLNKDDITVDNGEINVTVDFDEIDSNRIVVTSQEIELLFAQS